MLIMIGGVPVSVLTFLNLIFMSPKFKLEFLSVKIDKWILGNFCHMG